MSAACPLHRATSGPPDPERIKLRARLEAALRDEDSPPELIAALKKTSEAHRLQRRWQATVCPTHNE